PRPATSPPPATPQRRTPAAPPQSQKPQRPGPRTIPGPPPHTGPTSTDVCALGRKYGGWRPDSPEALICEDAQSR
ncbi:hypothetical protein FGD71_045425, partial [Streptomyces sporangiiformans]